MRVTVRCSGQLRAAVGEATWSLDLGSSPSAEDALRRFADVAGADARAMLLDGSGAVQRTLVVAVGDSQVGDLAGHLLSEGDTITILHPISGG